MKTSGGTDGKRRYRMSERAAAARARTNQALEAAIDSFTEKPFEDVSLEEIAVRAQVSARTVIRRFGSKDALFVAAMKHAADEMMRQREAAPAGDVAAAVSNLIEHYEQWGMNRLRLLAQEERIPVVAEHVDGGRRYHRSWVERTFAHQLQGLDEPARSRRVAALVAVTDVYMWKLLRHDLGLSRDDSERTLVELIGTGKGKSDG